MATLLSLVQDAANTIGLLQPTSLISSSDPQARNFLAAAQREGRELARRHNWQALLTEATFNTVASTEGYSLPSAFDRIVEGSMYDRTQTRPVTGPLTAQRWQQLKSTTTASPWNAFRIRGSQILIFPTPTGVSSIYYEYVSKYWCGASADTSPTQEAWAADDDITFLDEELMRLGIVWRYLRARGLDYAEAFRLYEDMVSSRISNDGGMKTLDLGGVADGGTYDPYIQDGSWTL